MKIIVAAVPGSGKTTILKLVKKELPKSKVVNMGNLVLNLAKKEFGIRERDELRNKLTIDQQRYLQETAARKIASMKSKHIFIDTHISIKTPNGYFPGLSEKTIHIIKPDLIIVLEFNPKDILERRLKDKSRKRDIESLEEIEEHQRVNREFALSAATHTQSVVKFITFKKIQKKKFEHAKIAAKKIVELIKSMKDK